MEFTMPSGATKPVLDSGTLEGVTLSTLDEIRFEIDDTGYVGDIQCVQCIDKALVQRIEGWRFRPSTLGARAVRVTALLEVFPIS
jgi:hypothetical protein